jgi:glucosamine kinase
VTALVAGIDGGQSSTVALLGDERGRILGRGLGGPADEIGAGSESTRLRDALAGALADACRRAAVPSDLRFAAIVAGISGYDGRVYGQPPELPSPRVLLMHDGPIAHAGALGGHPGIVIIAGTGSVIYASDNAGSTQVRGGWGFLFGDEGSAFRIASDALALLMRAQDESDSPLFPQTQSACEFFGVRSLRRLVHAFNAGEIRRDRIAAFAPVALQSECFRAPAYRGADRLALLAGAAIAAGAAPRIALSGGVFSDAGFRERVRAGILAAHPGADVRDALYEPAAGALLLAYREIGLAVSELAE